MQFENSVLASFGYTLPDEVVTTEELEDRLSPLYQRLKLPEGRLELMTGIRERRFWPATTMPGEVSLESARKALQASALDPNAIGALIHGSVCRDQLEPATACRVHHGLDLPENCLLQDTSNACLGILNGILHVAMLIEMGTIEAGLVVGTENGRALVDNTVRTLNEDQTLTRASIKPSIASLTIGAASVAVVVAHRRLAPQGHSLQAAVFRANTSHHELCQSEGHDYVMQTDSDALLQQGVATAEKAFDHFLQESQWKRADIDHTICHQVGVAHQRLLFDRLGLDLGRDFGTFEWLGNTGAAALPITAAIAQEEGRLTAGTRVAFLGIGSGINTIMMSLKW